jgi:hypothetical protein
MFYQLMKLFSVECEKRGTTSEKGAPDYLKVSTEYKYSFRTQEKRQTMKTSGYQVHSPEFKPSTSCKQTIYLFSY